MLLLITTHIVTHIHCEATGAPAKYVQVVFRKVEPGDAFTAGKPNEDFVALEAQIRPGRSEQGDSAVLI
ncbi:hypothetical protein WJX79_003472 [Trebouxia sp. C0005]